MTTTTLEDLSVELFYEIFIHFQFHEVFNIFSNLNSRFATIVNNMPLMPVYLGLNGMSIFLTEFYYTYLSQSNVCNRLISLYVSDTLAIDNGLWLAKHLSAFTNLRHLSLVDIKRSSFELILNTSTPNTSLLTFSVRYSPNFHPAVYTFRGVPEGAYYERIFQLFPSLRQCHLRFRRCPCKNLDGQMVLPLNQVFMPIETRLLNLQSIVLRQCSLHFLKHLLEHHPQLEELNFSLAAPWLPDEHPLINVDNK
jgi:hypothetical protein